MTREHKLALILGFSVVLVVGVLISDHFSDATGAQLEDLTAGVSEQPTGADKPIERSHATQTTSVQDALPGGFSIDGKQESNLDSAVAIADRPAFKSSREALLNEIQKSWNMTQNALPAAELDQVQAAPTGGRVELFEPVADAGNTDEASPPQQPIHTLTQLLTPEAALPEPTRRSTHVASREAALNRDVATKKHRVEEDESLWSIAQEYYDDGALYGKLAAFNSDRIGDDNSIHVGVVLRIPPKSMLTGEAPAPRRAADRKATSTDAPTTYTVASGDTLGEIAQRLLGSSKRWGEIVELNGIEDPDVVPVGTRLRIPATR